MEINATQLRNTCKIAREEERKKTIKEVLKKINIFREDKTNNKNISKELREFLGKSLTELRFQLQNINSSCKGFKCLICGEDVNENEMCKCMRDFKKAQLEKLKK